MSRILYIIRDEKLRAQVAGLIASLNLERPWSVSIEPYKKKRSLNQNALYHKWVGIIADVTGNSHDDVHDVLKSKFCPVREITIGDKVEVVRSTTKLNTLEFKDYADKVYAFAQTELGILLPVPGDPTERESK